MKSTDEITHNGKTLTEILKLHKMWLYNENGGIRADLSGANLSGADLSEADLIRADLSEANLSEANLSGADLSGADLSEADLSGADLSGADLSEADLIRADLSEANLSGADLIRANLIRANLSEADLIRADLSWANLSGANLSEAKFVYNGIEAKRFNVFNNLYKYCVYAMLSTDGVQYVRLGCKFYSREDWNAGKGINNKEFPDDGSESSELRKFALATAFAWLDVIAAQQAMAKPSPKVQRMKKRAEGLEKRRRPE